MKKILWIIFLSNCVFSQSSNATVTLYKDGFALVAQPVKWALNKGVNTLTYDLLPSGVFPESPFLALPNADVLSQTLNSDVFRSQDYFVSKLGGEVELKTVGGKYFEGSLLEYSSKGIMIQEKNDMIFIPVEKIDYLMTNEMKQRHRFKPSLEWSVRANKTGEETGNIIYLSTGFDWNAVYRFIMDRSTGMGELISEAFITNNSGIDFSQTELRLVEGTLHRVNQALKRSGALDVTKSAFRVVGSATGPTAPKRESLGDYHEYLLSDRQKFFTNQHTTVRLYSPRWVNYEKEYVFENRERVQRSEPLVAEIKIANTKENKLNIPLPAGKVELYHAVKNGSIKFVGEDYLDQIPTGSTATLTAGRAFDVRGKRKVLQYDRQRKSEEATIELQLRNTKEKEVTIRAIEHISGDWVIRDATDMYIKKDASTIYFPLTVPAGETKTVTYTYRKEWK